jgi:hypothetical protein
MGFLPICQRAAFLPRPFGLFPTKSAVLGAANGVICFDFVTLLSFY